MTKSELKEIAKKANVNLYSIKRVSEKGNKGWALNYSNQLNQTTVSVEKSAIEWNKNFEDIAAERYENR